MSVATMLIDIHMDGASPIGDLRRCGALLINYRVGLFIRVPEGLTDSVR
jgi:hypothetical protein